ncbi:bifunctional UDP-sugar hydrolase/5'-nucleotidase [Enorma phocaeensis]|uniref:Bifunctional UDP-sugar hydrolase/5'-nucleotidase n=1 Tax=Enorma phocaeensis TaxID=1871019 RepID=A0ABT7V845_9ACTN|nr:bifunctional UDP-sugar hydrolase/5'-nucleotidase [Enorma phocaeensis]
MADTAAHSAGSVDIVHVNDIHGRYEVDGVNAFAALKGVSDEVGAALTLDAGDTFHGDSFSTVTEGESIARLMEASGIDATTPGNHDWSYGATRLDELDDRYDFSMLAANAVYADTGEPYFDNPYLLKTVRLEDEGGNEAGDAITIGVIGVIDEDFYSSTPLANVEGLRFADPAEAATRAATALREQGADIVICLTHNEDPQGLAQATSGIDAVISGHEHLAIDETVTAADGREVPVVEVPSSPSSDYFGVIGVLTLEIQKTDAGYAVASHTESQVPTTTCGGEDDAIVSLTEQIVSENSAMLNAVIGYSDQAYPYGVTQGTEPGGWERVRTEDTPIGHVVTGSYLALTGADLAFENAGGIRAGVPAGEVTAGDLISISPYGNTLATYELTGAQILETLERSLDISAACRDVLARQIAAIEAGEDPMQYSWPDNSGSVIVVGGATMQVAWGAPSGERIRSIAIDGEPLDGDRVYTVSMNSYLPGLADEYPAFASMVLVQEWGTCEEALRALVSETGWEERMRGLTGTVEYVAAGDSEEPSTPASPESPDTSGQSAGQGSAGQGAADAAGGSLPKTGDPSAWVALIGGAGALAAGSGVVAARRGGRRAGRRRAWCSWRRPYR